MNLTPGLRGGAIAAATWLIVGFAGPTGVVAQQPAPPTPQQEQVLRELQEIQEQLASIEWRAVEETPALKAQQTALEERVLSAMIQVDATTTANLQRLNELPAELQTAEQQQDAARMEALLREAHSLHQRLEQAQATALQREDIARDVTSFQEQVLARMKEMEPRTEPLLARSRELIRQLQG